MPQVDIFHSLIGDIKHSLFTLILIAISHLHSRPRIPFFKEAKAEYMKLPEHLTAVIGLLHLFSVSLVRLTRSAHRAIQDLCVRLNSDSYWR